MVGTILSMLGHDVSEKQLKSIIEEVDADGESYIYIICLRKLRKEHDS